MSVVKKEARLTGLLLARKGTAAPAHTDHRLTKQVMDQFEIYGQEKFEGEIYDINAIYMEEADNTDNNDLADAINKIETINAKQNNSVKIIEVPEKNNEEKVSDNSNEGENIKSNIFGKRIAMTLRMDQQDHLKLRLYAAHTRKSCQEIISEALDGYLSHKQEKYNINGCNRLTE